MIRLTLSYIKRDQASDLQSEAPGTLCQSQLQELGVVFLTSTDSDLMALQLDRSVPVLRSGYRNALKWTIS